MKPIGPYVAARDLTGDRPAAAVRTLHATDRLTGMPVLLHMLPHATPLPELPADPALLRPSEGGIDGDAAYVVTELPPHAHPAADPLLAARGALAGLAALHEAGLAHGGVGPAQLWSMDGRVALAGAGLPWGEEATPARDLRALADTLKTLGGVPPALQDAPEEATARDLLARLDAPPPAPRRREAPPRTPTPKREERTTPPAEVAPPPGPTSSTVVLGAVPAAPELNSPPVDETTPTVPTGEGTPGEVPTSPPAQEAATPATTSPVPSRRVPGEPVRITWNADGTRRVVKEGTEPAPPSRSRRAPGWLLPTLLLLLLFVLVLAGMWWARRTAAPAPAQAVAASQTCCEVRFTVQGGEGVPVRLSVVSSPAGSGLTPGQEVGRAPGVVRLPRPGAYTLRVAAQGYTPGTVTVTAPSSVPVQITLTP